MARRVEIEKGFGKADCAPALSAQLQQGYRIDLGEADVFGQLIFAVVEVLVGDLHAFDVEPEFLAGEQSLFAG